MSIFDWFKKGSKNSNIDEYTAVGYENDDNIDYSEVDGYDHDFWEEENQRIQDEVNSIRGTISSGTCPSCWDSDSMKFDSAGFFYCEKCKFMMDAELYYRWYVGDSSVGFVDER